MHNRMRCARSGVLAVLIGLAVLAPPAAALAAAAGIALGLRRRRRGSPAGGTDVGADQLAELRRALRRSGRDPQPHLTLELLAGRFAGTPAEGYIRALAGARYGYEAGSPTPDQRAALRRELGAGLGVRGRLRAWWALPPRPPAPLR